MPVKGEYSKNVSQNSGFTFIELIVGIVIIALLFGVGFASYRDFQQRQRLIAAQRSLKADIRFTQEQALAGIKPPGCVILDYYRFSYINTTSYQISAVCDGGSSITIMKDVNFSVSHPNIIFTGPFSAMDFKVLGRGVCCSSGWNIGLQDSALNTITTVVNPGGEVN